MNKFKYTEEQQLIFDQIIDPTNPVLAIKATAGSSKSHSLVAAIQRYRQIFPDASVRYLIFGKMAADEAKKDFGTNAVVSTLHSYALNHIKQHYTLGKLKSFLNWRDIPKSIRLPFGSTSEILSILEEYCKSDYTTLEAYKEHLELTNVLEPVDGRLFPYVKRILNAMASGQMPITHSFYLKLFHIRVASGKLDLPHEERLLVDEFQDMSGMALDIINAIPADQKVFVGDSNQAIFSFLNLKDGFAEFPDAKVLNLSKSFRVDHKYAPAIQQFLRTHLEPDAVFNGMEYPSDVKSVTKAYLTRTNASLIGKMIELNKSGTPYHLSHKTKLRDMFKFPLAVIYAKPGFDQKDPELKHLQHDIDDWGSLPIHKREQIALSKYLEEANPDDNKILSAINLTRNFDRQDIIDAYNHADEHKHNVDCNLQLMTAHTSKGATRDIVELDDDLNKAIEEIVVKPIDKLNTEERAELCLYFVAITRHRHELINATYLNKLMEELNNG